MLLFLGVFSTQAANAYVSYSNYYHLKTTVKSCSEQPTIKIVLEEFVEEIDEDDHQDEVQLSISAPLEVTVVDLPISTDADLTPIYFKKPLLFGGLSLFLLHRNLRI